MKDLPPQDSAPQEDEPLDKPCPECKVSISDRVVHYGNYDNLQG